MTIEVQIKDGKVFNTIVGHVKGSLPLVDEPPEYDPVTQILTQNGYKISSKKVDRLYTITEKSSAERAKNAMDNANDALDKDLRAIAENHSIEEVNTWAIQQIEASGWNNDNSYPTPFIDAVLVESEEVKADFVNSIIEKSIAYAGLAGTAVGKKRKNTRV